MFKKVALVAVALAMVTPVFAKGYEQPKQEESSTTIVNKSAYVSNYVGAVSNTGANLIGKSEQQPTLRFDSRGGGYDSKSGSITTGAALASVDVTGQVNYTAVNCGCSGKGTLKITNTKAGVDNYVLSLANTGFNKTYGGDIGTGAGSANAVVTGVVNTTLIGQ